MNFIKEHIDTSPTSMALAVLLFVSIFFASKYVINNHINNSELTDNTRLFYSSVMSVFLTIVFLYFYTSYLKKTGVEARLTDPF